LRTFNPSRVKLALLVAGLLLLVLPLPVHAQEGSDDTPLGDVARSFRKKAVPTETVIDIDNDNLSKVIDEAESKHAAGGSLVFSLDPAGKNLQVSSPDVTCSLSFSSKTSALLSDPVMLDELPRSELAKLDGPATIDGDSLQVSMHNGTAWDLREVVIGLTIVRRSDPADMVSYYGPARIVPAAVGGSTQQLQDSYQKQPDVTVLLRVKGSAAPSATATFRMPLNFALFPDQEWHWAIVKAKGVPPPPAPDATIIQPEFSPGQTLTGTPETPQIQPATPVLTTPSSPGRANPAVPNSSPARPDATIH
jgi:hypothetical protein